ncbi:MAG: ABC transporter permease, partial [Planctomycetes bacterium]|nr:ABC transporter permease [Planctomycetota bacterium]
LAVGFPRRRAGRALIAEGMLVAAVGGALGVVVGTGYAWLMITGLRTWWVGAITTPFLQMYITPLSLAGGYLSGVIISALTIGFSMRFMRRTAVRSLLAGRAMEELAIQYRQQRWSWLVSLVLLAVAVIMAVMAARSGGQTQAASFVGAGAAVLAALLIAIRGYLKAGGLVGTDIAGLSLGTLAARNAARNPTRSTMTVGLMAVASFLIIAMGAFRAEPTEQGTGGFDLIGESDQPIFENLNTAKGRDALLGNQAETLQGTFVASLRVRAGDDAACTNLYRPSQPRVLGVTSGLIQHFDDPKAASFGWAATAAQSPDEQMNPWRLLESHRGEDGIVPVVMDMNTAMYSLQLYGGVGEEFEKQYGQDEPIRFRVVGLLNTCILQGSLLIHEEDFLQHFPDVAGYRMFLIRTEGNSQEVASVLEDRLSDQGFDARSAVGRLEDLLAVQNTYLSTFQTLGALGLLLGTFGLATVQVRNVFERKSELALMRAAGFRRARLATMVLYENIALLLGGLLSGFIAAMVAVVPYVVLGGASVPLRDLTIMLAIILAVGILSSLASVRSTLRAPLLPALRGE